MPRSQFRRVWIFIAGVTVILVGIIMAIPPIPGPGFLVIPMGIAILATEFPWARRLFVRLKELGHRYLPNSIARRIHISDEDAKMMSDHRNKRHASAAD